MRSRCWPALPPQPGHDLAGDDLDLRAFVAPGDEDDPVHPRRHVFLELRQALVHRADDRALRGRFAPRRDVPLGTQPLHHLRSNRLAAWAHHDRKLVGALHLA